MLGSFSPPLFIEARLERYPEKMIFFFQARIKLFVISNRSGIKFQPNCSFSKNAHQKSFKLAKKSVKSDV